MDTGVEFTFAIHTYKLLEAKLKMLLTLRMLFCILVNVARSDKHQGRLAQLGEHLPYKQGVIGSSPIVPTKDFQPKGKRSLQVYRMRYLAR